MEIHQALTHSTTIRNVFPRQEQGGVIYIATSSPGAMNLVSGVADALFDSVTLIAITGHVPRRMIGTMVFQETPLLR